MTRQDEHKTVQQAFDTLGNPLRFQIYLKILQKGCGCDLQKQTGYKENCVSAIMDELKLPQSTVSSYLKDLENWGMIECKKNGKFVYCVPKKETLLVLKSFIDSALKEVSS